MASLFENLKSKTAKTSFVVLSLFIVISTAFIPSITLAKKEIDKAYSVYEIEALEWIKDNTPDDSVALSTLEEGHLITDIAERKNFMDSNFMFAEDVDQRLEDMYKLYRTTSQTEAVALLNEYNIDYIYFSKKAKKEYFVREIPYIDEICFEKLFENQDVIIYESICVIKGIK